MIGHIRDKGGSAVAKYVSTDFTYVGDVAQFIVPKNGLYKLEVWGAQGGNTYASATYKATGGLGGYACGYKKFKKGDLLYVAIGGHPQQNSIEPGYNGGGRGYLHNSSTERSSGGGGATHIALTGGTLKEIGYDEFVTNVKGLIVAGGGGGSVAMALSEDPYRFGYWGGAGGGSNGLPSATSGTPSATSGTQTSAGKNGGFGYGGGADTGSYTSAQSAGGGGGFYGGGGNIGQWAPGTGGSGWIGGVQTVLYKNVEYMPSMETGVNEGNGKATITFITS